MSPSRTHRAHTPRIRALTHPPPSRTAGKGDEVAALLAKVRAVAESSAEPNNLSYRTIRSEDNPDAFIIFEEYILPDGITEHGTSRVVTGAAWKSTEWLTREWRWSVQPRARRSRR